jgi:hypothetical protein
VKPFLKIALVAGGYMAALCLASAVVAVHMGETDGPGARAAGGMYAFGDSLYFVGVFGLGALPPTGAALYFLRPYPRFWQVLSILGLSVAATGVVAAVLFAVGRHAPPGLLARLGAVSVLRILAAPLLTLAFLVCTILAPHRFSRLAFLAATVLDAAVSLFGGIIWFLPLIFQRN